MVVILIQLTMLFLLYIFTFTTCVCCTVITESRNTSGVSTSRNHPGLYEPNTNTTFLVHVEDYRSFTITISNFSLEPSVGCKVDSLTLYKGIENRDNILAGPLCGKLNCSKHGDISNVTTNITFSLVSHGFSMNFITDKSVESTGYVMSYTSTPANMKTICDSMLIERQHEIHISPSFLYTESSYPLNLNCEWDFDNVYSDSDYNVEISVKYMSIQYSGPSCEYDKVQILPQNGNTTQENEQKPLTICGSLDPFTHYLEDAKNGISVTFVSNNYFNEGGFYLVVTRSRKQEQNISQTVTHRIRISHSASETLFLHNIFKDFHCSNESCYHQLTFVTDYGFYIRLQLSEYSDKITGYDGPSSDFAPLIPTNKQVFVSYGFYLTISFNNSIPRSLYLNYKRATNFSPRRYHLTNCNVSGIQDGVLTMNTITNINIVGQESYFCYLTINVPQDHAVSVFMRQIEHSHCHSTDECTYAGVVIYDGFFDSEHRLGPFCEVEKGYLQSLFDPLVTFSSKAFIFLYSYAIIGTQRKHDISIDITVSECNGTHILPFLHNTNENVIDIDTNLKISMKRDKSENIMNVNITKGEVGAKCIWIVFHSDFKVKMLHKFIFQNLDVTQIELCEYFGNKDLHFGEVSELVNANNKHCTKPNSSVLHSQNNTGNMTRWSVSFQKLFIGTTNQKPATLINTCAAELVSFPEKDFEDVSQEKYVHTFPGLIDIHSFNWFKNAHKINPHGYTPCYITLICHLSDDSKISRNTHYFELYITAFRGRKLEIKELSRFTNMESETRDTSSYQYKVTYETRLNRVRYRSISSGILYISHYFNDIDNADIVDIHYQVKPYTNVPLQIGPIRKSAYDAIYYNDYQYTLHKFTDFSDKLSTISSVKDFCQEESSEIYSATTIDKLETIKTAFSTRWATIWIENSYTTTRTVTVVIGLQKVKQVNGEQWRWADGSPLTYSDWYYPDQVDHNIPQTDHKQLDKLAWITQPNKGQGYSCVVMRIYHPRQSTNWESVNCDDLAKFENLFFICEKRGKPKLMDKDTPIEESQVPFKSTASPNVTKCGLDKTCVTSPKVEPTNNGFISPTNVYESKPQNSSYKYRHLHKNITCPQNWTFIRGKCWLLLRDDSVGWDVYDINHAKLDCEKFGGSIADIDNLDIVKKYLIWSHHKEFYGNIWMTTNGMTSCLQYKLARDLMEDEIDRLELQEGENCTKEFAIEMDIGKYDVNVFPELRPADIPVGCKQVKLSNFINKEINHQMHTHWLLVNMTCTPKHVFCTREVVPLTKTCLVGYFQCPDGSCLSPDLLCDGINDCLSGEDEQACELEDYFFTCESKTQNITMSKYCDFFKDCEDGTDESNCVYPRCSDEQFTCHSGQCVDQISRCNGIQDGCLDHSDELYCGSTRNCTNGYRCNDGTCIHKSKRNDGRVDCDDDSDEPYLFKYIKNSVDLASRVTCVNHDTSSDGEISCCAQEEARCSERNVGCFNKGQMCLLEYDSVGVMKGCSNGVHLTNCSSFECPGRYKCPGSYCIDMKLVCNGVVDCRYGEDEAECDDGLCPGLYRCGGGNQTFCLSTSQICNGEFDCANHQSEEKYCHLPVCPTGCVCRGYYYNCHRNNISHISRQMFSQFARVINLGDNHLNHLISNGFSFSRYFYLTVLRLHHNHIHKINAHTFHNLHNLLTLDLSYNRFHSLGKHTFKHLSHLKYLILTGNSFAILYPETFIGLRGMTSLNISSLGITEMMPRSINGLSSLKTLDLSANDINIIEKDVFDSKYTFKEVLLQGNTLSNVPIAVFKNISSTRIQMSEFRFCCYTNSKYNCTPSFDIYSSCDDLMSNRFLQIAIWVIGVLSLVGNICVMICRLVISIKTASEVCIFALSFSDLLTGIYLIIIASTDTYYRGNYIIHDVKWRDSTLCQICGILSTLSTQLSSCLLLVITLERFKKLVFPMKGRHHHRKTAMFICIILFLGCLIASFIPLLIPSYFGRSYYSKTPLCLAYDFNSLSQGWEYTLAVFILINLFNCIVTIICYITIYCSVSKSSKSVDPNHKEDVALAKTLFLLVLTDLICWFPIIITSLSVVNGYKVPRDMAAMLAVIVLPINAALNPYLYTISSIQRSRSRNKLSNS